jgi:hypothetical protein
MSKHSQSKSDSTPDVKPDPDRFKHLPEPVDPAEMVTTQDSEPPPDPEGGRDTDRDFMIRYSAG